MIKTLVEICTVRSTTVWLVHLSDQTGQFITKCAPINVQLSFHVLMIAFNLAAADYFCKQKLFKEMSLAFDFYYNKLAL